MPEVQFDINLFPLVDSDRRWYVDVTNTSFSLAITKDAAQVSSVGDGDLASGRWRTAAGVQTIGIFVFGDTEEQLGARMDAWLSLLNQETITIGRTVGGVRRVATGRMKSVSEPERSGMSVKLIAQFTIPGVYWRDVDDTTVTLTSGSTAVTALAGSTAPIADCLILAAGASTALTALRVSDDNSGTGIAWDIPTLPVGTWLNTVGGTSASSANGKFNTAVGVAVDTAGNVFVADLFNHRIEVFSPSGTFIRKFGTAGTGNGQLQYPTGIAVDSSGYVYVVDSENYRVQVFTSTGTYVRKFGTYGTGDGQFYYMRGVAVDSSGNVFVTDTSRIQKFSPTGTFISEFGSAGTGNGQFTGLSSGGIFIDSADNIYTAESGNNRVQVFDSSGTFVRKFGTTGSGAGQFNAASAVAVAASGDIFVAESDGSRVQIFTSTGTFKQKIGTPGAGNGQFSGPTGLALDSVGNLWVADAENNRIQKFDVGVLPGTIGTGKWLLIDVAAQSAQIVTTADFDATGDRIAGVNTIPWAGARLRITPTPTPSDILTREMSVSLAKTGGGDVKIRVKGAYL